MPSRTQALTLSLPGVARVLEHRIHVCAAFDPTTASQSINPTTCGAHEFSAIWDTGATNTTITSRVIQECGLKPIGVTKVQTASGELLSQIYLVALFLPNHVFFSSLRATEARMDSTDVLIGMDVITRGDLSITNVDGRTTFSYRNPSIKTVDFVKEYQASKQQDYPKVGRNDPCPCGSGKKYKRCHGQ